jgi:Zn-dependent M28 family amino/carboxypeptidase
VLEVARALRARPARRTVILFLATGEEVGMLGTRWYLQHPVVPIDQTVAGLFVEMIGRPDSLAGGPGRGWLTGFERSTVGAALAAAGVPLVPDPRPAQNFFERSDNTPFARLGVPAHVISSFNLHGDYHRAGDEAERIDYPHMAALTQATITAVRTLADGPRPQWNPGGRPAAPR